MVTSEAPDPAFRLTTDLFAPLGYVLFNAGDFSGRVLAGLWPNSAPAPGRMLAASIARMVRTQIPSRPTARRHLLAILLPSCYPLVTILST
eukprot:4178124-Pyramimonas_sp.AAC.1